MAIKIPRPVATDPVVRGWLETSIFEIIPMRGMDAVVASLPPGVRVHVTRSPAQPLETSLHAAVDVARRRSDLTVVPHLAARCIRNRRHLTSLVHMLAQAGINDAFVIAGDATDRPAGYVDSLGVIRDLRELAPDFGSIGIPGYPDGHPFIAEEVLAQALQDKARYADFISTQMCFSTPAISAWLLAVRAVGVDLPVHVGVPGVISRARLLRVAIRIGVGQSTRFLRTNRNIAGTLLGSSTYRPDAIVDGLRHLPDVGQLNVAGFHLNTFNQVDATEAWRQELLASA